MNRPAFLFGLGLGSLLLAPLLVIAQAPPAAQSPHGDLAGDCATCHTAEGWKPLRSPLPFDHQGTGFPLLAAHAQVGCRDCHQDLVFSHVPTACADCHRDAHRGEMGPNCETCHHPESWTNRREAFRTHSRTRFPLLAPHAGLDCEACHRTAQPREYTGLDSQCVSCHRADYLAARNPDHARLGFSQQCESCHSPASRAWTGGTFGASFPHPSSFPLTGTHSGAPCARCHAGSRFAGTPTDCLSCHQDDYNRAQPDHRTALFGTRCQDCHATNGWEGAIIDHNRTAFPLTGAHVGAPCARCHVGGRFAGTPTNCVSCHQDDYDRARPDHRTAGFPTTCQDCHATSGWEGATIDHNRTAFPLTGAHTRVDCAQCHVGGRFAGTPTSCVSCHQDDYDRARPDHRSAGFPTSCQNCHSTNGWEGAAIDHNLTAFPLTGAHRSVECGRCHVGGRFAGTPTSCVSCHQDDYDRARPDHRASGFPTSCQNCHGTNQWGGATFNHPFPLRGPHAGIDCTTCHTNSGNFRVFECTNCHAHRRNEMDDKHKDVRGYQYNSAACYRCHPSGRE